MAKRLARLWVVLIPAIICGVVIDFVGLHLFPQASSIYAGPPGQTFVSSDLLGRLTAWNIVGSIFFLQSIFVYAPGTNIPLWSLANEFWYYLEFPLLMLIFWPRVRLRSRITSIIALTAITVMVGKEITALYSVWLLGALIAAFPLRLNVALARSLSVVFALGLLPWMFIVRRAHIDILIAQWCIAAYFGVLLYSLLHLTRPNAHRLYCKLATALSDISYPLYLIHLPVLIFICAAINTPWHRWTKSPTHIAEMLGADGVAVLFAFLLDIIFQSRTDQIRTSVLNRITPLIVRKTRA